MHYYNLTFGVTQQLNSIMKVLLTVVILLITGCHSFRGNSLIENASRGYFETYSARKDFDKFIGFYAEEAILKDIVYGVELKGIKEISEFFDWSRGSFKLAESGGILEITSQIVSENKVITEGRFEEFYYADKKMGPWEFVIWQEYNASGKIVKQNDWINYTPKKILIGPDQDK